MSGFFSTGKLSFLTLSSIGSRVCCGPLCMCAESACVCALLVDACVVSGAGGWSRRRGLDVKSASVRSELECEFDKMLPCF